MELEFLELALDVDSLQRDAYMHFTETMSKFIHSARLRSGEPISYAP